MIGTTAVRVVLGALLAAGIASLARRTGSLSPSGAIAATVAGTVSAAAGWSWAFLLIIFFVTSSELSRFGGAKKKARTESIVAKGGARDATQVAANGGVYAAAAALSILVPWPGWMPIAAGAIAAAASDTWGTEIGTLSRTTPRLVTTGRRVSAGTSGAITLSGTLGAIAGATTIAGAALVLGWGMHVAAAALLGGAAGAYADSLLGALWQEKRQCTQCGAATERHVHSCGGPTVLAGGIRWLDNDAVNFACGVVGALVALAVWRST